MRLDVRGRSFVRSQALHKRGQVGQRLAAASVVCNQQAALAVQHGLHTQSKVSHEDQVRLGVHG